MQRSSLLTPSFSRWPARRADRLPRHDHFLIAWSVFGGTLAMLLLVPMQLWRLRVPRIRIALLVALLYVPFAAIGLIGTVSLIHDEAVGAPFGSALLISVIGIVMIDRLCALLGTAFALAMANRYAKRYTYFHGAVERGRSGRMLTAGAAGALATLALYALVLA